MSSGRERAFLAVLETSWSCADLALAHLVVPDLLSPNEMGEGCVLDQGRLSCHLMSLGWVRSGVLQLICEMMELWSCMREAGMFRFSLSDRYGENLGMTSSEKVTSRLLVHQGRGW